MSKGNQREILEVKSTIAEMKNSLSKFTKQNEEFTLRASRRKSCCGHFDFNPV